MSSFLKKIHFFMDVDLALFCFFSTILLQWIILSEFAGFLIKPFHITMFILLVNFLLNKNLLLYAKDLFKIGYYFFVMVFLFILMEILSLFWTKNIYLGISLVFRQSMYIFMGFSLVIKVVSINHRKMVKTMFFGCLLGVVIFF